MIYKRHLLTLGWKSGNFKDEPQMPEGRFSSMGEDEQWETLPKDSFVPRTWWRKWLKLT